MYRVILIFALLISTAVVAPQISAEPASPQCKDSAEKKAKRSMFGSIFGNVAGSVLGSVGGTAGMVASYALPVASLLSDQLLKLLDCKEQQQAAKATDDAIRGGVGTEISWKSETRANVTGRSKVTGEERLADGSQCLTVNDVVIVDGEETTVPKRLCRGQGASGYARA